MQERMQDSRVNVIFAADDNYAEPLRVAIASLVRHCGMDALDIWVIDGGISPVNRGRIRGVNDPARHGIEFRAMKTRVSVGARTQAHLSDATLSRLFVPALFPDLARCIFLDVDVFVFEPVKILWDTDLSGHPLGLVESAWLSYLTYKRRLGIAAGEPYFNCGVMLMDLDHLRRSGSVERWIDFLAHRKDKILFADQDVINGVMKGCIRPIHPRWNVSTSLYDWRPGNSFTFGRTSVAEAISTPAIAHFTGMGMKPWQQACVHPLAHHYRHLAMELSAAQGGDTGPTNSPPT
jgi:lipopolysaccharide biosynthesis glycosyltransferase